MTCTAASHAAIKSAGPNAPQWLALQYLGRQTDYGADLELRVCGQCGSTLAIEIAPGDDAPVTDAVAAACADAREAMQRARDASRGTAADREALASLFRAARQTLDGGQ